MKLENLPDGGHDKVIWKRSRDRSRDKASQQRNSETWWTRTIATLLGVSFGSYRRRRRDVLMGRRGYVPLSRLGGVPLRCRWVFHLTLWRGTDGTSIRPLETSSWHTNKKLSRRTTETSWRCSTETTLGVSFETYLRRHWDLQRDILTTSPRRLVAGWEVSRPLTADKVLVQRKFTSQLVKRMIKRRYRRKTFNSSNYPKPPQGLIPTGRTKQDLPFSVIGTDYAGSFTCKTKGNIDIKVYLLLFTSSLTRAVHLGILPNQTTQEFIQALKRIIARMDRPKVIYSDNAKIF